MKDWRDVQDQLERALGTLMSAVEQQPDTDLAEAVDHVSAALTRLRAAEDVEGTSAPTERPETDVARQPEQFLRKGE